MNDDLGEGVAVVDGRLVLKGETIERFRLDEEIGRGANGVVYKAQRVALDQPCALKIWLQLRTQDRRNKVAQGLAEARALAAADPTWVATVYDADTINRVFFSSMEYLPGMSLRAHLNNALSPEDRWWLARLYINAISHTTSDEKAHGDAHAGNVIVFSEQIDAYETRERLKLIDFGTSIFSKRVNSRLRHWKVVNETFRLIVTPLIDARAIMRDHGRIQERPEHLIIAYYDDVLSDLRDGLR